MHGILYESLYSIINSHKSCFWCLCLLVTPWWTRGLHSIFLEFPGDPGRIHLSVLICSGLNQVSGAEVCISRAELYHISLTPFLKIQASLCVAIPPTSCKRNFPVWPCRSHSGMVTLRPPRLGPGLLPRFTSHTHTVTPGFLTHLIPDFPQHILSCFNP